MSLLHNSKHKIKNIQRTIDGLLDGDFPLSSGRKALSKLRDVFDDLDAKLDRIGRLNDEETLKQISSHINLKIYQVLPILGFILRSTNVRNAFELLDPLQTITDAALQGSPYLLLSSEWDYIPFAYPQSLDDLKSFVLIGLPASEAASALLLPLAGHELGHAVWRNLGVGGSVAAALQHRCVELYSKDMPAFQNAFPDYKEFDFVNREILPMAIAKSLEFAARQAEELFCDLFAYAIFGSSYLHAFSYIVAPGGGIADSNYPLNETRIAVISRVAASEGRELPTNIQIEFRSERRYAEQRHRYIVKKAEESVSSITERLWTRILEILRKSNLTRPDPNSATKHAEDFLVGIPTHAPLCLGDVVNAGWIRYAEIVKSAESLQRCPSYSIT
ncbi:MAG: hypothetical protein QOF14_5112 [Hyphomicrobiales bacterium]|jgi:hypothetical protein|nr:hypothetical protein [Hyphomicrobiales bacterium]